MIQSPNKYYFSTTEVVDWQHPKVFATAQPLASDVATQAQLARACQHWVRDNIVQCSADSVAAVSCNASDVLQSGLGSSFSSSHLLAALLRANGLASSFCYQRKQDTKGVFKLHGYCAVWLTDSGWYPLEVSTVAQQPIRYHLGECHYRLYSYAPLPEIVRALQQSVSWAAAEQALPSRISMG